MNITYSVIITPQAQKHIQDICSYMIFTLQVPDSAYRFLDYLQARIYSLKNFPIGYVFNTKEL